MKRVCEVVDDKTNERKTALGITWREAIVRGIEAAEKDKGKSRKRTASR